MKKLRDAEGMLNAGQDPAAAGVGSQRSDVPSLADQYGGRKAEEAKRLKEWEEENRRLKQLAADQALDIQMLKHSTREIGAPFAQACAKAALRVVAEGLRGGESDASTQWCLCAPPAV